MKNKIYSKLFQFCDPKYWIKEGGNYKSTFYPEYKLEFKNKGITWQYYLYQKESYSSMYSSRFCHKGFVTLNLYGKLLSITSIVLIFLFLENLLFNIMISNLLLIAGYSIIGGLITFLFSFFNWEIYLSLRKAQNSEKLKIKDNNEKLEKEIVQIVNQTIAKNPKLARKKKLIQLNKKWF